MRYISTRGGTSESRDFSAILLEGLAPDGGLYMPDVYPQLDIEALRGKSYRDICVAILSAYAPEIPHAELEDIVHRTYTAEVFGSEEITPLKEMGKDLTLLQLSQGPTLAFKDIALQLLGNLMQRAVDMRGTTLNILGATSGDTGSAAEYAVRGRRGLRIFMLSPKGRMSRFQQKQMYTLDEPNVFNIVVDGTFDDCQALVKEVNADNEFKMRYSLGAVNSINWARILAQTVYYVVAYVRATSAPGEEVSFSVPSGNFGNVLAAYVAMKMGVPVRKLIVSTNANDVLDEFFKTGVYRVRKGSEVRITSSPSMDIASASNFERLIFEETDRDAVRTASLWAQLGRTRTFEAKDLLPSISRYIVSGHASDEEVLRTIRRVYDSYGVVVDPHTAVGVTVGLEHCEEGVPLIVAETAQPAKFADTIRDALGFEPPVPEAFAELTDLPEKVTHIAPTATLVKEFIAARVR